jgi:DNA invertase Pin-like site-specific DNA recombinase
MGLRAALYLRVSTTNQDTERQDDQLRAVAAARGWEIVEVYADNGKSGEKPNAGLT